MASDEKSSEEMDCGRCSGAPGKRTCRWRRSPVDEDGGHPSLEMTVRSPMLLRALSCWSKWEVSGVCGVRSFSMCVSWLGRVALGEKRSASKCRGAHAITCQ